MAGPRKPKARPSAPAPPAPTPAPSAPAATPSPWSGFHKLGPGERFRRVVDHARLSGEDAATLAVGRLDSELAGRLVENHVGLFPLPLGVAVGFVIDGTQHIVPMAVEESSVIAAASHGAKMAAGGGGFRTKVGAPVTIGQVEVRRVRDQPAARALVARRAREWMRSLDATIPTMVARGGGVRRITTRTVGAGSSARLVAHLHVDCRDAMGANLVNTLCETFAPMLVGALQAAGLGGQTGLRILSNLATDRIAVAQAAIPVAAVGGAEVARAIVEANRFAQLDPYRAATHNKGILNGIDPVAVATGNDWRAVEAGAHAYAARKGTYGPLTTYRLTRGVLHARLELPLSVGTVGGVTRLHPTAAVCLKLLGNPDAQRLAAIMASVGLAQNLSALRALATSGIQAGHMALHAHNVALAAGLTGADADRVAQQMRREGKVGATRARELASTTTVVPGRGPPRARGPNRNNAENR